MLICLTFFITSPVHAAGKASEQRLDEVAGRASHVMPFDLEKITHIFSKTDTGGILQIITKNESDSGQISLIRVHLSGITREFQQGDYSNPEKIHVAGIPGLAELKSSPAIGDDRT
ncbi:MAG: hypothetical protein DU480_04480 [Nitrosomonas sp.]|uniref:hypothetical protein n=1 Tax=Nitrosomonas sp. TaxID=42353 RepID=UPI0032EDCBFF